MAMQGAVIGVTGNFDRQILSNAVRKAGGRVDALVHKNLQYVSCCPPKITVVCSWGVCVYVCVCAICNMKCWTRA